MSGKTFFIPLPNSTVPLGLPAFPRCQSLQRGRRSTQSTLELHSRIKVQARSVQQKSLHDDSKSMRGWRMRRSMFAVSQSKYVSYQVRANGPFRLDTSAKSALSLCPPFLPRGMAENSPDHFAARGRRRCCNGPIHAHRRILFIHSPTIMKF